MTMNLDLETKKNENFVERASKRLFFCEDLLLYSFLLLYQPIHLESTQSTCCHLNQKSSKSSFKSNKSTNKQQLPNQANQVPWSTTLINQSTFRSFAPFCIELATIPSLLLHPTTSNINSESIEFNLINNANQLSLLQSDCKPVTIHLNPQLPIALLLSTAALLSLASRSIQRSLESNLYLFFSFSSQSLVLVLCFYSRPRNCNSISKHLLSIRFKTPSSTSTSLSQKIRSLSFSFFSNFYLNLQ